MGRTCLSNVRVRAPWCAATYLVHIRRDCRPSEWQRICRMPHSGGVRQATTRMGLESFASGSYPTKGCFRKNGKAFFSPGMPQEMSELDLPGLQERIWCGGTESSARRIALGSATFLVILAATMLA